MSMTRTPPIKLRQIRTRSALQVGTAQGYKETAPVLPRPKHADDADDKSPGNERECQGNQQAEVNLETDGCVGGESGKLTGTEQETGEKSPSLSTPSGSQNPKTVGKLDTSAYKPFGSMSNVSISRSSSDTSDSSSETAFCQGGPGNPNCGVQVVTGDKAVQCDRCHLWFHAKCQSIPKVAHDALVKYKCLSWLCTNCKAILKAGGDLSSSKKDGLDLKSLERQVQDMSDSVRNHMKSIVQSVKEQEKAVSDNSKLLERFYKEDNSQKSTYADMVRGTCDRMVEKVNAKIDALPRHSAAKDTSEASKVMSTVFDNFIDKEKRKLNVVVHNLPELDATASLSERSEKDRELFKDIIKEGLNLIIHPTHSFRVGKKVGDNPRLLIVTLEDVDTKAELLKMAPQLRYLTSWKRIYVTPDLSKKEREEGRRLREELAARRQQGEENIMIRRGRIVKVPEGQEVVTGRAGTRGGSAPSGVVHPRTEKSTESLSVSAAANPLVKAAASAQSAPAQAQLETEENQGPKTVNRPPLPAQD